MEFLGLNSNEALVLAAALFFFISPELCRLAAAIAKGE
jgi:hypothetical protein